MIERGQVIKNVFLKLGENTIYNDNSSDLYNACNLILDVVIDNIAYSTAFLFNAVTVKLNNSGKIDNEYKFNLPVDYLNVIRCDAPYRIENESVFSENSKIKMQYCRRIDLTEFPDNTFNLLVSMTAREMALAFKTYNDKLEFMQYEVARFKNDLVSQQGFQYWGD